MKSVMKALVWTLLALICGFIGGIVLSDVTGIVGVLVFHRAVGFRFLPVCTALASAGTTLVVVCLMARQRA